ncbi:MAG: hypothetical protein ABW155_07860 [Candidatus Thiodiazotropha sp.]
MSFKIASTLHWIRFYYIASKVMIGSDLLGDGIRKGMCGHIRRYWPGCTLTTRVPCSL